MATKRHHAPSPPPEAKAEELRRSQARAFSGSGGGRRGTQDATPRARGCNPCGCNPGLQPYVISTGRLGGRVAEAEVANASAAAAASCGSAVSGTCLQIEDAGGCRAGAERVHTRWDAVRVRRRLERYAACRSVTPLMQ